MNNTQLKVKQQVAEYLNNYEGTEVRALDNLFVAPKREVFEFAEELKNGDADLYTKDEYIEIIKSLSDVVENDEKAKAGHERRLKQFEDKDFDAMFISADCEVFFFSNGDFEKQYLNDLLGDVDFDTTDLDDNWMEDETGFYTTDLYEINWALKYKRGVEIADEQNVDASQFEHDDYIQLAQKEMDSQREEIERYLWNYRPTHSTEMDEKFAIFKSDVADLAKDFRSSEAYVYSKMEFLEFLYELAYDAEGLDREYFESLHKEIRNRNFDALVDKGSDYYYYV